MPGTLNLIQVKVLAVRDELASPLDCCARRERPSGHRTAYKCDELAPLHVPSGEDHALCNS